MKPFSRFAAIDWSGAKGSRHKGIAVAVVEAGDAAPRLVKPGHVWSRMEVLDWIAAQRSSAPTLIGMDFSFAPPFVARGAYLPGEVTPNDARAFWAFVDAACADEDLGAASFLERSFRRHFYFGKADGTKADFMHLRTCEAAFNATGGGKPSTVFDAIGAAQVAKASFAGMRLLHHLAGRVPVWPFDFIGAVRPSTSLGTKSLSAPASIIPSEVEGRTAPMKSNGQTGTRSAKWCNRRIPAKLAFATCDAPIASKTVEGLPPPVALNAASQVRRCMKSAFVPSALPK